jgi:ABC-type antimicrobial peptide transport system permease subunit
VDIDKLDQLVNQQVIEISNEMITPVIELHHKIRIRNAIGESSDTILHQFLMEALLISGAGALLGIAIAVSIPVAINYSVSYFPAAGDLHVPISWMSVALSFVVSCSTGLVFGYLPANRAARLQPTESLRRE